MFHWGARIPAPRMSELIPRESPPPAAEKRAADCHCHGLVSRCCQSHHLAGSHNIGSGIGKAVKKHQQGNDNVSDRIPFADEEKAEIGKPESSMNGKQSCLDSHLFDDFSSKKGPQQHTAEGNS